MNLRLLATKAIIEYNKASLLFVRIVSMRPKKNVLNWKLKYLN